MANKLLDYAGLAGKSLGVAETTNIHCSLTALSRQLNVKVSFWGRIDGYNGDYFVAQADGLSPLDVNRKTFYSVDGGVNWAPMPEVNEEQYEFCEQIRGPFLGLPTYEYKVQKELPPEEPIQAEQPEVDEDVPAEEPADDEGDGEEGADGEGGDGEGEGGEEGEEGEKKPEGKKKPKFRILAMFESVRLAHFVQTHDRFCRIVPRGAFVELENGTIAKNRTFSGLSVEQATNISHYFHVAKEKTPNPAMNRELFKENYNRTWDILPSLSEDMPKNVWSVKHDPALGVVTLQNLLFLGSLFYHKPGTAEYGQMYFGSGERNLDLCFMLP